MPLNIDEKILELSDRDRIIIYLSEFKSNISKLKNKIWKKNTLKEFENNKPYKKNIHIIYRHVYYVENLERFSSKSRPDGFSHKKCFENLLDTIEKNISFENIDITIYYNGTFEQLKNDQSIAKAFQTNIKIYIKFVNANSALEAYLIMLRSVKDQEFYENDILYFLENDYLHHQEWIIEVFNLYNSGISFDYLSLYDHPDRYKKPKQYKNADLYVTDTRHWITAPSTCASFITLNETFKRDFKHFYTYKHDHLFFLKLTKQYSRRLLTPIPGLATHCMSEHLDSISKFEKYFIENEK